MRIEFDFKHVCVHERFFNSTFYFNRADFNECLCNCRVNWRLSYKGKNKLNNCTHCLRCLRRRHNCRLPTFFMYGKQLVLFLILPLFTCTKWHKFIEEETIRIDVFSVVFGSRKRSKSERSVKNSQITTFSFLKWINAAISESMRRYIYFVWILLLNERKKKKCLSDLFSSRNLTFQRKSYHTLSRIATTFS